MQLLDRVKKTEFLGREFLLWLWFRSETNRGEFDLGEQGKVELWFDGRMTLQSESEQAVETITCSGENPLLREARFALTENKQVTQAAVKLIRGDHEWTFLMDSTWMNFRSFKTPKVLQDNKEDPDGMFYEKMFLVELPLSLLNHIFASFISLRVSPEWQTEELPALVQWIREGKQGRV
jgi:hypothetical protein